jgi:hypothetical protein
MTQEERRRALDGYGADELAIPEWRLIQKVGADYAKELGGKPGQFYNSMTDEIADELNLIIVDILSGRARWGSEITGEPPLCASQDSKSNRSINGDDCTKCEHRLDAPWSVDASERREKCCLNYTLLAIDLDHDHMPVIVRGHGISALPIRQLITQLTLNRNLKREYHRAVVNLKSQAKDTKYGTAYALRPKVSRLITDEKQVEELKAESLSLLGTPIPLPEGRPEDEPIAYTPEGEPVYTEEDRKRVIAELGSEVESPPAEQRREEKLDLDF